MSEQSKAGAGRWKIILCGVAVVAAVVLILLFNRRDSGGVRITADHMEGSRISTIGMFTVRGAGDLDRDQLASRLVMDPFTEFQVRDNPDDTFTLLTYRPLEPGKRLEISLLDDRGEVQQRWEFQTSDRFEALSAFPADGAADVPPSSAAEIKLSHSDLDRDMLRRYVTVSQVEDIYVTLTNSTLVISPSGGYFPANETIEITLSADLPRKNGETLGKDYTFTFQTGVEEDWDYRLLSTEARVTENILPGDSVLLKLDLGRELFDADLTTTVYRYDGPDGYLDALRSYRDARIAREYTDWSSWQIYDYWQADLNGLEQVLTHTAPAVTVAESYERYVLLPEPLEEGWYAASVEATTPSGTAMRASKLIQVNPLSVFYIQPTRVDLDGGSSLLAWVNNTETGSPADNARIKVTAPTFRAEGTTGEDGVASLSGGVTFYNRQGRDLEDEGLYVTDRSFGLLEVEAGDTVFHELYGDGDGAYSFQGRQRAVDYTAYLFTDRPVYRHTDTIKVWGLVKPWKEGMALPEGLRLTADNEGIDQPLAVREDGTFQTEIKMEAMSGSGMRLQVTDSRGEVYVDLWLMLEDYVKPEYETAVTLDKPVYAAWEDDGLVGMDFTAHYYEGTPAQGYTAEAREPEDSYNYIHFDPVSVATDADGFARLSLLPGDPIGGYEAYWRPVRIDFGIYSDAELGQPQVQGGSFYYLARDRMLLLEAGEDGASVTARVHSIDTGRIQTEADLLLDENLMGDPVDAELSVTVQKSWYERVLDGERYDAVNKTTVGAFSYEYREEQVDSFTATTENGVYTFTGLPTAEEQERYTLTIMLPDGRGNPVTEEIAYTDYTHFSREDSSHRYTLLRREAEDAGRVPVGDIYGQYFSDGETLDLYLTDRDAESPDPGGQILYVLSQDGIIDYGFAPATEFQLPFSEGYLPNYSLSGAYFDGRRVYALRTSAMVFHPGERELEIDIQPEEEIYRPGDTATITFQVTEKATGKAASGASLVAAVVDEAVFAIEEQDPAFLSTLYRQEHYGPLMKYTSYDNRFVDDGGFGGGGPNPFVPRVDFPDTAAFVELTTGQDGKATLEVELPDNLTSWRVTALALSEDDKKAGDTKENFAVSKDFFVSPVLPARWLAGDDMVITVHSAGRQVNPDDTVGYTCAIAGVDGTYTGSGRAGDFTPITLDGIPGGSLPEGEYQLTVTGTWNGTGDTVTLPFTITGSGVTVSVTEHMSLADAADLQSQAWPVTLGFYDRDNELHTRILSYLASQDGNRVDQKMAKRYALEQMKNTGIDTSVLDTSLLSDSFREYVPNWQGYRLFPYSGEDEVLTARIDLMAHEYYSGGTIYGIEELSDDPAERAATYLLVYDWEPEKQAEDIKGMLDSEIYAFRDKMFLVAALARMDYTEEALAAYERLTASLRAEQTDADGNLLVSMGSTADTAAASMAANLLSLPDAEGMARYLLDAPAGDGIYLLELMFYLQNHPLEGGQTATVTYERNGETVTARLDGFAYQSFTKEQLTSANLRGDGEVWASAVYTAGLDQAMSRDNAVLVLSKTVEPVEGESLEQGGLARITLTLEIPDGVQMDKEALLMIQDYIPTGMRYESMEAGGWQLADRNDQRVSFGASRDKAGTLTYYARCVTPGSYVVESGFVSTATGSAWAASDRTTVEIQP